MMGSWQAPITGIWIINFVIALLCCTIHRSDAQTAVGFEFREKYSSIADEVEEFQRVLLINIREVFSFTTTEVPSVQVSNGTDGRILVNLTLTIDTTVDAKILAKIVFEQRLRNETYFLLYKDTIYNVLGATVWIMPSLKDIWYQYAPEIAIAVICGLAALALFVSSIHLLCMNRKSKRKDSYAPQTPLPVSHSGNSLGRSNGGFVMEEVNGGHRVHTPKSSIGSTRFVYDRDTLYDKLIYGAYEVPPKHLYSFL